MLGHFKTKDGDITVYGPGNLLIITDTGTNIRRMMQHRRGHRRRRRGRSDLDRADPLRDARRDIASALNELFDLKGGGGGGAEPGKPGRPARGVGARRRRPRREDRRRRSQNSLVIVATERAYLRILELIKRLDVPQTGEGEIHVLPLQHADAIELAKTLNEIITGARRRRRRRRGGRGEAAARRAATGIFEAGVKVSADKATNSIVVTSSLRDYAGSAPSSTSSISRAARSSSRR